MKKTLGIIFVFFMFYSSIFCLDPCFPGGITFSSQHDIDIYKEIYPSCTEITGDVIIEGDDIVDLDGIDIVTNINGDLIIRNCPNLTSIHGLLDLVSVGGDLIFSNNDKKVTLYGFDGITSIGGDLLVQDNNMLTTITGGTVLSFFLPGLQNVTSIGGGIFIESNAVLEDLDGLADLVSFNGDILIEDNPALSGIYGLSGISNGVNSIEIIENNMLANLVGLHNIPNTSGHVIIEHNDLLFDLNGLDGLNSVGDLIVLFNDELLSLEGLSNLEYNTGVLSIQGNSNLHDLNGLTNLTEVGSIIFFDNPNLEEITDLHNITSIDGGIYIEQNNALSSLQGIDNISINNMYEVYIFNNTQLSICDVESICNYLDSGEPVFINGNAPGCATEEEVDEACSSPTCPDLFRPQPGETDVDANVLIKWFPISNAEGFIISIGSTPYGTEYVDHEDVGNVITYQYPESFPCGATIYVRILAYNDHGESLDCSYSSFTIESAYIQLIAELNICKGDSVLLEPITNGYSITWSPPDGLDDPNSFTPNAAPESSTTYTATVSSAYNNCNAQSFTNVIVHEGITGISLGYSPDILCSNDCSYQVICIPAGGEAPFDYVWSNGDTTYDIDELCAGPYTVYVTDANACTDEAEIILYEYPVIDLTLDEIVHVTDTSLGSISMNFYYLSNPFTYTADDHIEWTGVDFEYYSNDASIDNLSPGCYRLTTFGGEANCSIDTVYCVEDNTTGLYETDNFNSMFKIYPNPTSSTLFIDVSGETDIEATIALVDLSGRELKSFKMKGSNVIDVSTYKPGLYFIKVSCEGKDYYKKVIFME